jgi:hypothetical protein
MAGNNNHPGDEPRNPHVHHEPGDVNAKALTKFGVSMAFLILIFLVGLWGLFDYLKNREAELGLPLSPRRIVFCTSIRGLIRTRESCRYRWIGPWI